MIKYYNMNWTKEMKINVSEDKSYKRNYWSNS